MTRVVLYGNGPMARSVYYSFTHDSPYEVVGFTVDKEVMREETLFDLPVIPFEGVEDVFSPHEYQMFIAVGYIQVNQLRAQRYLDAKRKGYEFVSIVDPRALVDENMKLGENCAIGVNAVIDSSVTIGNNVIVGAGSFVGHDTLIGDHCFIGDHVAIAGSVSIGEYSFLGTNCTIRNKITIARESVIGAGAVILKDTKEREVYIAAQAELLPITSDNLSIS